MEFHQSPPQIQLPPIKVRASKPDEEDLVNEIGGVIQVADREDDGDECRTPKSEEHKIPVLRIPPPAPRKKRGASPLLKRKRSDSEIVDRKEIEEWFRSCYGEIFPLRIRTLQRN
ncbi:hypothetical protein Nepgr_009724 [Nepenthes gracilis]|uniref:Uncharacterized protein n=1 Tax=Nepenthes gracilis TaxID=150966 RepID=A0AAD3SBV4_NEPGR|nr:hypothetical protein Nepgr_009724 [Nepenthes gracilis]